MKKKCSGCEKNKELSEFPKNKNYKDGYKGQCKKCTNDYQKEYQKEYRKTHSYQKEYYEKWYKDTGKELRKEWYKEWYEKKGRAYYLDKYHNDMDYRLKQNVARRIRYCIKKESGTSDYLGCDIKFYRKYLEEKFTDGMSWDNYGEWEIDHIKPLDKFDLEVNQFEAFNYKNTQPLWKSDNRKKSSRY
jgi:hypothetical protein